MFSFLNLHQHYYKNFFGVAIGAFIVLIIIRYTFIDTPLRVSIYLFPLFLGMLLIISRYRPAQYHPSAYKIIQTYFLPLWLLYITLTVVSFVIIVANGAVSGRFIEEVVFIFAPLLSSTICFALFKSGNTHHWIRVLFWGVSIAFLIEIRFQVLQGIDDVIFSIYRTGFLESQGISTESVLAFSFGFFIFIFVRKRDYTHIVLSILFFVIAYKRVAILGIAVTAILSPLVWKTHRYPRIYRLIPFVAVIMNLAFVLFIIFLGTGNFDGAIISTLNMNPDQLLLGRRNLYEKIILEFGISPSSLPLIGNGLGSVSQYLEQAGTRLVNPHSDLLKGMIEWGIIGYIIWIATIYNRQIKSLLIMPLLIYLNILWSSDNVLIYFEVMFLFYILSALILLEDEEWNGTDMSVKNLDGIDSSLTL